MDGHAVAMGIDPGLDGGIALWDGSKLQLAVMPTIGTKGKGKRELDIWALSALLTRWNVDSVHVYLERVASMPKQGVASMFSFGYGYGAINGILAAVCAPYTLVTPPTWQKPMIGLGHDDAKKVAAVRAKQLFPGVDFLATPRSKEPHSGLVDAALIAYYGRLHRLGRLGTLQPSS